MTLLLDVISWTTMYNILTDCFLGVFGITYLVIMYHVFGYLVWSHGEPSMTYSLIGQYYFFFFRAGGSFWGGVILQVLLASVFLTKVVLLVFQFVASSNLWRVCSAYKALLHRLDNCKAEWTRARLDVYVHIYFQSHLIINFIRIASTIPILT